MRCSGASLGRWVAPPCCRSCTRVCWPDATRAAAGRYRLRRRRESRGPTPTRVRPVRRTAERCPADHADLIFSDAEEAAHGSASPSVGTPAANSEERKPAPVPLGRADRPAVRRTDRDADNAKRVPIRRDPVVFSAPCFDEIRYRLQPVHPQMHPVGVRPVDRVSDDDDQFRLRELLSDPVPSTTGAQIERRASSRTASSGAFWNSAWYSSRRQTHS